LADFNTISHNFW